MNIRAGVTGLAAGALAVAVVELVRARAGARVDRAAGLLVGVLGAVVGFWMVSLTDRPLAATDDQLRWTAVVAVLAGLGHLRLERRATSASVATWLALAACGSVWLGVPENRPALVITGVILGTLVATRGRLAGTGFGHCLGIGWAIANGFAPTDIRHLGALAALAPLALVVLVGWVPPPRFARRAMPALVLVAAASGFAAARWIGVAPDATMARVAIVVAVTAVGVVAISDR